MKVEIECKVKVVGASVEEALARVTEKMSVMQLYEKERVEYAAGYHHWNNENDGDVDWSPVHIVKRTKDGAVQSELELRIRNV